MLYAQNLQVARLSYLTDLINFTIKMSMLVEKALAAACWMLGTLASGQLFLSEYCFLCCETVHDIVCWSPLS